MDEEIIALFLSRDENAIRRTHEKYGSYCYSIAYRILTSREDSEECVNDTYLKTWRAIPPQRPRRLQHFLGKITRNLALDRYHWRTAGKRGGGEVQLSLDELSACIPALSDPQQVLEGKELTERLNLFLAGLTQENRKIFLMRYWNFSSVAEIAAFYGITESKVKMTLLRTREKLRAYLEKEGITV